MVARTPARFLAPLALVACVVAAVIVLNGGSNTHKKRPVHHAHARLHVPRIYHVRPGQGLSEIASRYAIPLNQILTLNPQVDPRALQPGERLQLVP